MNKIQLIRWKQPKLRWYSKTAVSHPDCDSKNWRLGVIAKMPGIFLLIHAVQGHDGLFFSEAEPNLIESFHCLTQNNPRENDNQPISHRKWRSLIFKHPQEWVHTLATASAWYCIPYLPRSEGSLVSFWSHQHCNIADKWGVIPKKNMVYHGVIGFDQSPLWSFEWL